MVVPSNSVSLINFMQALFYFSIILMFLYHFLKKAIVSLSTIRSHWNSLANCIIRVPHSRKWRLDFGFCDPKDRQTLLIRTVYPP